jgi:hypothetical protein
MAAKQGLKRRVEGKTNLLELAVKDAGAVL